MDPLLVLKVYASLNQNPSASTILVVCILLFCSLVSTTILYLNQESKRQREETINNLISESKRINESIEKLHKINSDFNKQRKISDSEISNALLESKKA